MSFQPPLKVRGNIPKEMWVPLSVLNLVTSKPCRLKQNDKTINLLVYNGKDNLIVDNID